MKKIIVIALVALALILTLTLVAGCNESGSKPKTSSAPVDIDESSGKLGGTLTIFHAGSLAVPFSEMETEFENLHPSVKVEREPAASGVTIRKVTELGKNAEIVASADYSLIPDLMFPDYADWYITFARNQMVLCYTNQSRYANEINSNNWFDILLRDGVEYGHGSLMDPCGYRTLLVWQLAEAYYDHPGLYQDLVKHCPAKNIRTKSEDLLALLETGNIDYAFEYSSVAKQHNLKFVELPANINLSDIQFKDFYAQATVDIPGKQPGEKITKTGTPIVYGVTIPTNAAHPDLARAFIEYLLGEKGQAIMNRNGQPSIVPAVASEVSKLPTELQSFVVRNK